MKSALFRLFVAGGAIVYLGLLIGFTVAFADGVPPAAWVGFVVVALVVAVLAVATIAFFERVESTAGSRREAVPGPPSDGRERILVVADVGCEGRDVCGQISARIRNRSTAEILVVAPVIASPIHHLTDDEHAERASAGRRLEEVVRSLRREGVVVRGIVGSDLPLEAIEDALSFFPADEVVILAPPSDASAWSEKDLVERARSTVGRPVTHVPMTRREHSAA